MRVIFIISKYKWKRILLDYKIWILLLSYAICFGIEMTALNYFVNYISYEFNMNNINYINYINICLYNKFIWSWWWWWIFIRFILFKISSFHFGFTVRMNEIKSNYISNNSLQSLKYDQSINDCTNGFFDSLNTLHNVSDNNALQDIHTKQTTQEKQLENDYENYNKNTLCPSMCGVKWSKFIASFLALIASNFALTATFWASDSSNHELICQKHATSKLSEFKDLESLKSYGFRSVALSSLSATCDKSKSDLQFFYVNKRPITNYV